MRRIFLIGLALLPGLAGASALRVGDRLPAFTLDGWDGKPVASATLAGKPLVIDFWASWCATCKAALPALDAMSRRVGDRGVEVLAVNIDREQSAADAWLAERLPDRRVTLLRDPDGALLARLGADGMPAVYVVDRDGIVRFAEAGYAPDRVAAIERAVESALAPPAR